MTLSMTGFGRATGGLGEATFTVELSSVNHRYFECTVRLPGPWISLESALRDLLKKRVSRGKLSLFIRRDKGGNGCQRLKFQEETARQYVEAARDLARLMNSTDALSLDVLAQLEGVFVPDEAEEDLDGVKQALCSTVRDALEQFSVSRMKEGGALAADVAERIAEMQSALAEVEERLPSLSEAYEQRLRERVQGLAAEAGLTEDRLALEVALMAEKNDVNEEVVRLKQHFEHGLSLLQRKEPVGRDLNFLAQEMQREINTLGSKLRDIDTTREVLRMKGELEKLREQAQNIE